jgi:SAM-dependent methyltransferase
LLGPWWAAAVAAATTIVNGNFFENYFPFGVVNIAGGLVWGYLARAANLRSRVFSSSKGVIGRFVVWMAILTLAGGITCGLASTWVKLILYPELGRPFIYGSLYTSAHATLQRILGAATPEVVTLAAVDLYRDLADKLIVVPIAMLLVAVTRIAPTFGRTSLPTTPAERLQSDVSSILIFAVTYSAFIFLAQMTRPIISIPGSTRDVAWLGNPMMVVVLYAPLVVALLAFGFLTFRALDPMPRRLHALCRHRREVARHLFEAGGRWTSFVRSAATQALGTGVSIWPLRHVIDLTFGLPIALGVITAVLAGYLVLARVFYGMLQRAMEQVETVHRWLQVSSEQPASVELVRLMQGVFAPYFHVPEPEIARRNGLVYAMAFVSRPQRGRIEEALFGGREDAVSERIAVLGTIDEPRALTIPILHDLASLIHDTGAGLIALSSSTARVTDPEIIDGLRFLRKGGTEVLLLDWTDLTRAVAATALADRPHVSLRRARARALSCLNREDERIPVSEFDRPMWLADRALPSLKVVIGQLPKSSIVFDLGSGCGRHSIAAAAAGHEVVAVEWKEAVCKRLRQDLAMLAPKSGKVTVIHGEFLDLSPESSGLADLVICTGVLQHALSVKDLANRLAHIASLGSQPAAIIYIEMLFDMLFDGEAPSDGRIQITHPEFEALLQETFPAALWSVRRTRGPMRQLQTFDQGGRSFQPPSRTVESTTAEYLIRRLA